MSVGEELVPLVDMFSTIGQVKVGVTHSAVRKVE
jgi:hypothetical protein